MILEGQISPTRVSDRGTIVAPEANMGIIFQNLVLSLNLTRPLPFGVPDIGGAFDSPALDEALSRRTSESRC